MKDELDHILKQYWGYDSFRSVQREIIDSVYAGKDTLGLLPTGGGKSITFQVPAMAMKGMCLVVTPLISLMKDQVDNLKSRFISAEAIYSGMDYKDIELKMNNAVFGAYKFLYISPERLETEKFKQYLNSMEICLVAIDEAHCISQWGYDFRPSYMKIAELRDFFPDVPFLALTATAIPMVVDDIQERLKFKEKNVVKSSFYRPNLSYLARSVANKTEKLVQIQRILKGVPGTSVIYRRSREGVEELAKELIAMNISADYYHAGLEDKDKVKKQEDWKSGDIRVMVATNAFGMGIDKPDVRSVIHYELPDSLEAYFQEAGRGGRDGKLSYAVALYMPRDLGTLSQNLRLSFPSKDFCKVLYETLLMYFKVAIHEGKDRCFEFDIWKFCTIYHFNHQNVKAGILILEQSGYLKYEVDTKHISRVMFLETRDRLYSSDYDDLPKNANVVMVALMRMYEGLWADWVNIEEWDIFKHIGTWRDYTEVYRSLCTLRSHGIIDYIPGKRSDFITLTSNRVEMEHVMIEKDAYEVRKENATYRLENVFRYIQSKGICRSRLLLHYFGEFDAKDCGICDICKSKEKEMTSQEARWHNLRSSILDKIRLRSGSITYITLEYMYQNQKEDFKKAFEELREEGKIKTNGIGMLALS